MAGPALGDISRSASFAWIYLPAAAFSQLTCKYAACRYKLTASQVIPPGLWSASRHPNYFGEVLFWWGLYLFVPLAYPNFWWVIVGPLAILLLFLGISIPLMERHLLAGHSTYPEYRRRVSPFFPWFSR